MSEKIVSIRENESLRSATVNAVDALDREIDAVWGLIAIIEILDRESRDNHYASGALRIAHNHLEHVPPGLNREDSPGAIYEGFYRH